MTNQAKTNNLNCLIYPKFSAVNKLFVLLFENEDDRTSYSKYYRRKVEIKDFNVLIDGKYFFNVPIKNKEKTLLWILFKGWKTNCNRFEQANWIRKAWFKTTN